MRGGQIHQEWAYHDCAEQGVGRGCGLGREEVILGTALLLSLWAQWVCKDMGNQTLQAQMQTPSQHLELGQDHTGQVPPKPPFL